MTQHHEPSHAVLPEFTSTPYGGMLGMLMAVRSPHSPSARPSGL